MSDPIDKTGVTSSNIGCTIMFCALLFFIYKIVDVIASRP